MNLDWNDLKKILKGREHARIYLINTEKIIHSAELIISWFQNVLERNYKIILQNIPGSHSNGRRMSDHRCNLFFGNKKAYETKYNGNSIHHLQKINICTFVSKINKYLECFDFDRENSMNSCETLKRKKIFCLNLKKKNPRWSKFV